MAQVTKARYAGDRVILVAGAVGAVGLVGSLVGFVEAPGRAYHGWLTAFAFAVSIALGALVFLMTVHAAGSKWPVAVRRLSEAVAGTFPWLALAFLPVVLGAAHLYIWVAPPEGLDEHMRHLLAHKAPYLNLPFFVARGVFYLAVWGAVGFLLRRWSFADDAGPKDRHLKARALSAVMLPLVGLTLTFAAFDWLMSLEPSWFSTVFGIYWFAGGFVASLALLALLAELGRRSGLLEASLTSGHFHALGRLVFAFSIFWAYIAFFQAFLIQIANKPEEIGFYLLRTEGGWSAVTALLVGSRFVLPFFLLLPRAVKRNGRVLAVLGAFLVSAHYLDCYWLVIPEAHGHGPLPSVFDLFALLGVSGTTVAFAAWRMRGRYLLPLGDPRLEEALAYRSPT